MTVDELLVELRVYASCEQTYPGDGKWYCILPNGNETVDVIYDYMRVSFRNLDKLIMEGTFPTAWLNMGEFDQDDAFGMHYIRDRPWYTLIRMANMAAAVESLANCPDRIGEALTISVHLAEAMLNFYSIHRDLIEKRRNSPVLG